jgi:hypothetical protein
MTEQALKLEVRLVETKLSSLEALIESLPRNTPAYRRCDLERTQLSLANQLQYLRDLLSSK